MSNDNEANKRGLVMALNDPNNTLFGMIVILEAKTVSRVARIAIIQGLVRDWLTLKGQNGWAEIAPFSVEAGYVDRAFRDIPAPIKRFCPFCSSVQEFNQLDTYFFVCKTCGQKINDEE